jgi:hypothetical protein
MNANFLAIIKKIVSDQGEAILTEPRRLKGWISDYAKDEPKAERLAFGRCIECGAYAELKNTPVAGRAAVKNRLAQRLHSEEGLDTALCAGALDLLEAVMFGEPETAVQPEPPPIIAVAKTTAPKVAAPKSPPSKTSPAQKSKPFLIDDDDDDLSYISRRPIKQQPIEEKHTGRTVFLVLVLLAAIIAGARYLALNRNALSYNPAAAANHTQEQAAPERDINGLTAADYDINGWAKKDGKWVASPDGARYSAQPANTELPQVRIVNNTGYMVYSVYVVAVPAKHWGDDKLGSDILSNGSSVSIDLPSSSTNRYGIMLKDLDGDTYTKWDIPISNNQTVTFTIQDLNTN